MALTLNQVVKRLRSLALSHAQVNSFFFGDPHEFDANGEITYPGCFLEQQPGTIDRATHFQRLNFRVYFLDLVGVSSGTEENETEVLSDMNQVAVDFFAMLLSSEYQDDWMVEERTTVTPGTESLNDMVAGVVMEISIMVEFLADRCVIPSTDVEFETDFDMPRTKILTYTATGAEGNPFAVAGLSGLHVLAAWRAGSYKRVGIVTPNDSEKIKVGAVDLGSGRGILGSGTVELETGDALIANEKLDFLYYA